MTYLHDLPGEDVIPSKPDISVPVVELDDRVSMLCISKLVSASTSASGSFIGGAFRLEGQFEADIVEELLYDGERILVSKLSDCEDPSP